MQVEHTIEEARRQALVAKRYDCTVLMYSLAKTVNERKIFDFFCKANVGRIIDIKLIRDPKTGKSKNCSYVEFESQEVSMLAIGLSGAELEGQPVQIVPSQAEKNRHAAAAKFKKDQLKEQQRIHLSSATDQIDLTDAPMKIYVGGLTENLADITENDLHNIFEFGDIDSIELHRDPITGKSKGFAFIQFHRASQARQAIAAMNGFNYKGKSLKVGEANENNTFIQHDENIDGRNELMAKLSKVSNTITSMNNTATILESIDTSCIILTNLFNLNDERFITDEFFEEDLIEDVKEQCENFGRIEKIWIDKNSQGNIWIKYDKRNDPKSAFKAMMGLQGKIYDNRAIIVKIIPESLFNATVKMS